MKNITESEPNERICLACGEKHHGKRCPLIQQKYDKANHKQLPFIVGNIFLKCIEKDIDFVQILCEIAEDYEYFRAQLSHIHKGSNIERAFINLEILNYFAISLNCNISDFLITPKTTVEKFANLFEPSYEGVQIQRNEKCSIQYVTLYGDIKGFNDYHVNPYYPDREYPFYLEKTYTGGAPSYTLVFQLQYPIGYPDIYARKQPDTLQYHWESANRISNDTIALAIDTDGPLKKILEEEFEDIGYDDDYVDIFPHDDPRVEIWLSRLQQATVNQQICWEKGDYDAYITHYGDYYFAVRAGLDTAYGDADLLYMKQDNGIGIRFGRRERSIGHLCEDDTIFLPRSYGTEIGSPPIPNVIKPGCKNEKIKGLVTEVKKNISKQYQTPAIVFSHPHTTKKQQLNYTDVLVISHSLVCNNGHHSVVPMTGLVPLLTSKNTQINYEIYVGHCTQCDRYFVFQADYNKMRLSGEPLCQVLDESSTKEKKKSRFQYKSQSVLNAMGYTVNASIKLTSQERQKILEEAIRSNLFSINDLLYFLNWLVNTRKSQSKYSNAIEKWKEDIDFVENYKKKERESVYIKSMTIK